VSDEAVVDPYSRPDLWAGSTLGELLATPSLRLTLRSGTADAHARPVRWAHTTELLDPSPYLRGGELVCTVGATLRTAASCRTFAAALASIGAAGICFGAGDIHEQVPQALLDACHLHDLPVLELPRGAPFLALSEYLAGRRSAAEAAEHVREQDLLARLLAGLRAHATVADLLAVTTDVLGGRLDLCPAGHPGAEPGTDGTDGRGTASAPAGADARLVWSGVGPAPGPALLRQIGHVLDVAGHEHSLEQTLRREQTGHLLLLVGDGLADAAAVAPMLHEVGLGPHALTASAWPAGAASLLAGHLTSALLGEAPDLAIAVTAGCEQVLLAAGTLGLICGHGSTVPLPELSRGIAEARAAYELARRQGGTIGPAALTSLEALLEQQPAGRLAPYVNQLVKPLLDYDRRHNTRCLDTLRVFLRQEGSVQRTANTEYLHVNTVRHRLARVLELTGRNPLIFADRAALAIAVWAYDRHRRSPARPG